MEGCPSVFVLTVDRDTEFDEFLGDFVVAAGTGGAEEIGASGGDPVDAVFVFVEEEGYLLGGGLAGHLHDLLPDVVVGFLRLHEE